MDYNVLLSWVLLLYFIVECTAEASSNNLMGDQIDTMRENSKKKQFNNLTCLVCHSEEHVGCLSVVSPNGEFTEHEKEFGRTCGVNETSCQVKRIAFTSTSENGTMPMKTVAIKRTCSAKCEPGCVIMGERTRLYVCSTCCNSPMCNIGNGASINRLNIIQFYSSVTLLLLLLLPPLFIHGIFSSNTPTYSKIS